MMKHLIIGALLMLIFTLTAKEKEQIAVLHIDTKGLTIDPELMGNLVRLELSKKDKYIVMDRYDMYDMLEEEKLEIKDCYGKTCVLKIGKFLNADYILMGSAERYGEKIIINFKLLNVKSESEEKQITEEFINVEPEIQTMISIAINDLFNIENDKELKEKLTKKFDYETSSRNPGKNTINLNGPRMGFAFLSGDKGSRLSAPLEEGGYDNYPVISQFGYQHEVQYLSEGNFQAVMEFLYFVSGLDQQMFIPSFTFLNGFRNSKNGWEFGFGPSLLIVKKAEGYYDEQGEWNLERDWNQLDSTGYYKLPIPYKIVRRVDKRGFPIITSQFIWTVGRTFKSGHLNIPVNIYVSPNREGWTYGVSIGFNVKKE